MSVPAIACHGLLKGFDGVPVLKGIDAEFEKGTVTVMAGENGAGKSTLFKIISGQLAPDGGTLSLFGEQITKFAPRHALKLGVSIIPQELQPIPELTVYENLLLGTELTGPLGFLKRDQMTQRALSLIQEFGAEINPKTPIRELNIANKQLIEIIKAISRNARIVLMDEPTSSLSEQEIERLFRAIDMLRAREVTIVYTTHKMEEIKAIADRVIVLRDGALIRQRPAKEYTEREIITDMVGREIDELFPHRDWERSFPGAALEVRNFQVKGYRAKNSFSLKEGEIVGLAGLVGAGRSELMEGIFSIREAAGELFVGGRKVALGKPSNAIRAGIAMVPEERKTAGLVLPMSILDNLTLPRVKKFSRVGGVIRQAARRTKAAELLGALRVRYHHVHQQISNLSGGNQQKIVLARWLMADPPKVLLLDEPTRGIDVGAKAELYKLIFDLADRGMAILLASSDMNELLNLSHRVWVVRQGAIVGELHREELNQEKILRLAMGLEGATHAN